MKKVLSCLLAILTVCFLSACQGGSNQAAETILGTEETLIGRDKLKGTPNGKPAGYQLELPEKGEEIGVITLKTGEVFKLRFFPDEAPKAVYNFKLHALQGYYNGVPFHKVLPNFMIMGGDPTGSGTGGESVWKEPFEDEFNENLLNLDGAVSMANNGANTNGSQFFINCTGGTKIDWSTYEEGYRQYKDDPDTFTASYGKWVNMDLVTEEIKALYDEHGGNVRLDGHFSTTGVGNTVFAQVFEGMKAIQSISQTPTDPDTDRPLTNVIIDTVQIVPYT